MSGILRASICRHSLLGQPSARSRRPSPTPRRIALSATPGRIGGRSCFQLRSRTPLAILPGEESRKEMAAAPPRQGPSGHASATVPCASLLACSALWQRRGKRWPFDSERSRAWEENIRKKPWTKAAPWCLERAIKEEAFDGGPVDCAPLLVLAVVTVLRKSKELAH